MINATYKIIIRDYSKNADNNAPLMFQIFINKIRWRTPIGVYVNPSDFDKDTGLILKTHPDYRSLNLLLGRVMSKANNILVNFHLTDRSLTLDAFKQEYLRGEKQHDFITYFENELLRRKKTIHPITFRCQLSILKKLKQFSNQISIHDLNPALFDDMASYLHQRGNNPFTIWGFFKTIKTYVNRARRDNLITANPFKSYPIRPPRSTRSFLDEKEVALLYQYYQNPKCHPTHRCVLQYFLFSCLTGLRISDIAVLQHSNIIQQELHFIAKKNRTKNKGLVIPLPQECLQFITTTEGLLFNKISDQKTNKALKEISDRCKIKKRLTYHVSRHTFGYLLVRRGVNPAVVKELMGHEHIATTMIYVHINNEQKREGITRLNGLLTDAT